MSDPRDFVASQTVLAATPLVPEIALHLATEITPIWEATEAELERRNVPPPYWAFPWVGGQAVARHLLDHPELVRGKRLLDFAAGSGLAAIAAMKAGAASATAVEIDPYAVAAIGLNAEANGVAVETLCADIVGSANNSWDIVIAGDVCYEKPMAERVFAWLAALARAGSDVLMGDPGRAYLPKGLREIARYDVPTSKEIEDRDMRTACVYRLE